MFDLNEAVLKVRKKGVTILPKSLRDAAGIKEDSEVRARVSHEGILLRPLEKDPVDALGHVLSLKRKGSSVVSIRKLRKEIDRQVSSQGH